jgi:PAS domain S-box-containing protein
MKANNRSGKKTPAAAGSSMQAEYLTNTFSQNAPESELAAALENLSSLVIYFKGASFKIDLMNKSARTLWDFANEPSSENSFDAATSFLMNHYESYLKEVFSSGDPVMLKEIKLTFPHNGEKQIRYFNFELNPVKADDGTVTGIFSVSFEVTDAVASRRELQLKEKQIHQQLLLITDSMPLMIAYIDNNGRFRLINKMFEKWIGLSNAEVYQKPLREVFGIQNYITLETFSKNALSGELAEFKCTVTINKKRTVLEAHYLPHVDESNNVLGFFAIFIDITERRHITQTALPVEARVSAMRSSVSEMTTTLMDIYQKLDAAKAKLKRTEKTHPTANERMKKWSSDLKVSESITLKVKTALEDWLNNAQ